MALYKNNYYKEYPAHRVCIIDYSPIITEAIEEALNTCRLLGLNSSQWSRYSKDITKLFLHHCLEKLCSTYTNCPSVYRKAYVVYPTNTTPRITAFLNNNLERILKVCPVPWFKVSSISSPDIELAAVRAVENKKSNYSKLLKFTKINNLHVFTDKIQKKRIFSNSIVDFSRAHD